MPYRRYLGKLSVLLPWLFMLALLPVYPAQSMEAAARGIAIWWEVLFPALFPFFVISELLLGFGIVHLIGCLLDPMMRPLFRVPGYGGFVMAMGFASGYPIGARLTSQLWAARLVDREEGERLVSFTSTSDPIFLIGAVAVGFFHDAGLAVVLAIAHYGGGVLVGLCMRYHGNSRFSSLNAVQIPQGSILKRAFAAMHAARLSDNRSLGVLLQQSIKTGLMLVFIIGGLVVFVSVLLELLSLTGIMNTLYSVSAGFIGLFALPETLSPAFINGIFEVTLGAQAAGAADISAQLVHKTAMAAFVLSWAGLSVHAQIASLLTPTNLRYAPFVFARLLHGAIAMLLVYLLWEPLQPLKTAASGALPAARFGGEWPLQLSYGLFAIVFFGSLLLIPALAVILRLPRLLIGKHGDTRRR